MYVPSPILLTVVLVMVVGTIAVPLDLASNDHSTRSARWSSPFSEEELRSAHEAEQVATIAKWNSENEWIHEEDFLTSDSNEYGSPALIELGLVHSRCTVVSRGQTFTGLCLDPQTNHESFSHCDGGFIAEHSQQKGCRAGTFCCIRKSCSIAGSTDTNRGCYKESVCKAAWGKSIPHSDGARGCGAFADDVSCCDFQKPIEEICKEYIPHNDINVNAGSDLVGDRLKYKLYQYYNKKSGNFFCEPYSNDASFMVHFADLALRRCNSLLPEEWSAQLRDFLFYKQAYCEASSKGSANPYFTEMRTGSLTLSSFETTYKYHLSDAYKNRVSTTEKLLYGENGHQPKQTHDQIKKSLELMLKSSSTFKDFDGSSINRWDASTGQAISGTFTIPTPIAAVTVQLSADAGYLQGTSGSRIWGSLALRIRVGCEAAYAFINVQLSGAVNSPSFTTFPELINAIWFYFYGSNEENVKSQIENEIEQAYSGTSKSPTMTKLLSARLVIVKKTKKFSDDVNKQLKTLLVSFDSELEKVLAWGSASACGEGNMDVTRRLLFTDIYEEMKKIITKYEMFADEAVKNMEEWYPKLFPSHLGEVRDMVTKTFKEKVEMSVRRDMKEIREDLEEIRTQFKNMGTMIGMGLSCPMTGYQLESKLRSIRDRLVKTLQFDHSRHLMVRSWVDTLKLGAVAVVKYEMGKYDEHVKVMKSKWFKTEWIVDVSIGVSVDFEELFSFLSPATHEEVFEIAGIAGHKEERQIYPYRVEQNPGAVVNSLGVYGSGQLTPNLNLRVEYRSETLEHLLNIQVQYKVSDMEAMKAMIGTLYTSLEALSHTGKTFQDKARTISKTAGHALVSGIREYFDKKKGEWERNDRSRSLTREYTAKGELELKWGGSDGFYVNKAVIGYDDVYTLTVESAKTKKLFGEMEFEGTWTSSVEFSYRTYQSL